MKTNLLLLTVLGVLVSCTDDPSPFIEPEMDSVSLDYEGGNVNIKVSANVDTKTTITYSGESDGWIFLMPTVLKGDGVLSFSVEKYMAYDSERTATATIAGGNIEKQIVFRQTGRPKPQATDLDLDKYNIYSDVEGGTYTISVATEGEWTAASDADWCSVENGSAMGIGSFTIKVARSEDYAYRTANVKVTAGSLERTVFVQHVGTKIGDLIWANANVNDPDTFGENCEVRGQLYQWNSKVGYPSYSANDHGDPDKVVPGFTGGAKDSMSQTWTEENDPCPDGWRVPTWDELKSLIGSDLTTPTFWYDYWMQNGMSVAGAYVGLDRTMMQTDCSKGNLNGAIFIPQAGRIDRDSCTQSDWWDVCLWSSTHVGQTWDMHGIWLNGNQDFGVTDWYGSMTGMSVRCVRSL